MLDADSLTPHIHGEIVFQIELFPSRFIAHLFQESRIQTLQNPVIQMDSLQVQIQDHIHELKGGICRGQGHLKPAQAWPMPCRFRL